MFIQYSEKKSSTCFEFQYCKKEWNIKKLVKKGYGFGEKDSLLVPIYNEKEFFENYSKYLEPTNAPNGTTEFCYYGVNYYTKEQALGIIAQIKKDKPKDFETLVVWLEKAIIDYNGFFFLGI